MALNLKPVIVDNWTVFERNMREAVEKRLAELEQQLCFGTDVTDFPAYTHLTGYVKAYNEVLNLMVQVRDRLNKLERGQAI